MILLVTGGRDYEDLPAIRDALDRAHAKRPITMLVQGGAPGADRGAKVWATMHGIHVAEVPALWDYYKRPDGSNIAGPIRNGAMLLLRPDGVVAFPGGSGTADMVRRAEAAGIPVWKPYG